MGIAWIIFGIIWIILFAAKKYNDTEPETNPFNMDEDEEKRKKVLRIVYFVLGVIGLLALLIAGLIFASWATPIYLVLGTYIVSLWWHMRDKTYQQAKLHAKSCVGVAIIGALFFGGIIALLLFLYNAIR